MTEEEFLKYREFNNKEDVEELIDLLIENKIQYQLIDNSPALSDVIMGSGSQAQYFLKIKNTDFNKVNELYSNHSKLAIQSVEKDYYLFDFTNDELMDVVVNADQWNNFDVELSKKILSEKGVDVNKNIVNNINQERLNQLKTKEKGATFWVIAAYISAILGGIIGVVLGLFFSNAKKTLPNGERVLIFDKNVRTHGLLITIIGGIMVIILIYRRLN